MKSLGTPLLLVLSMLTSCDGKLDSPRWSGPMSGTSSSWRELQASREECRESVLAGLQAAGYTVAGAGQGDAILVLDPSGHQLTVQILPQSEDRSRVVLTREVRASARAGKHDYDAALEPVHEEFRHVLAEIAARLERP